MASHGAAHLFIDGASDHCTCCASPATSDGSRLVKPRVHGDRRRSSKRRDICSRSVWSARDQLSHFGPEPHACRLTPSGETLSAVRSLGWAAAHGFVAHHCARSSRRRKLPPCSASAATSESASAWPTCTSSTVIDVESRRRASGTQASRHSRSGIYPRARSRIRDARAPGAGRDSSGSPAR